MSLRGTLLLVLFSLGCVADDPETTDGSATDGETADSDDSLSCAVPEVFAGCEGLTAPGAEVATFARGIIVEADRAVLTFANVNAPALLCESGEFLECSCEDWTTASRFTISGALAPGVYAPADVTLLSAGGDCNAGGAEFDEVVVEFEITDVTDTCVAGRVAIEDGLGGLPASFGFTAPRCG